MQFFLALRDVKIRIGTSGALVGRSPACTVVLDGELVSRRHAVFAIRDGDVVVSDLSSENGVFVNGERMSGRAVLTDGDVVTVGSHDLRLCVADDEPSDAAEEPEEFDDLFDDDDEAPFHAGEPTENQSRFMLLIMSALVAIDRGDVAFAESKASGALHGVLEETIAAQRAEPAKIALATKAAVALARAKKNANWLRFCFALHGAARQPMSRATTKAIEDVVPSCGDSEAMAEEIRDYVAVLRRRANPDDGWLLDWLVRLSGGT